MIRYLIAISSLLILAAPGCYSKNSKGQPVFNWFIEDTNRWNLSRLRVGMPQEKVLAIMGKETYEFGVVDEVRIIKNPEKTERIEQDGKSYQVIYYRTKQFVDADYEKNGLDRAWDKLFPPNDWRPGPVDSKKSCEEWRRTPLVFLNGKLIGWGRTYWREKCPAYKARFIEDPNEPIEWQKKMNDPNDFYLYFPVYFPQHD